MIRTFFEMAKFLVPLITKAGVILFVIKTLSTFIIFFLYHIYFGFLIFAGPYLNIVTINLIFNGLIGFGVYIGYLFYINN